jgi:hypothetical protein
MPNRRTHDHIGQIRQKLGIRIGIDTATQVISSLGKLADANITISDIDKIVTKIINDPKFLTLFLKDYQSAIKTLKITTKI